MDKDKIQIFIRNLVRLLKKERISQDVLSTRTGIPISYLSRLWGGIGEPNEKAIKLLAKSVNLSTDEIIAINPNIESPGEKNEGPQFTEIEKQIINAYRQLPYDHWLKKAIDETLLTENKE